LYCPTEMGRTHISRKLEDCKQVFQHIMGGGSGTGEDIHDK
jgi:hypothetical protein